MCQITLLKKGNEMDKLIVWFRNACHFHHRLMAHILRKRGWVVFYLDKQSRNCNGTCWLELYQSEQRRVAHQ